MKNIHLIPTESYSPLVHSTNKYGGYFLSRNYSPMREMGDSYQHIYITNDEEIKEGDWVLGDFPDKPIGKVISKYGEEFTAQSLNGDKYGLAQYDSKKIILTTDQDLNGVQAIDDEFLEWFVKNPSCDEVEIEDWYSKYLSCCRSKEECYCNKKRIIIPQEEAKQRAKNYMSLKGALEPNQIKCYCGHTTMCDCSPLDEPKQETTLEETAKKYCLINNIPTDQMIVKTDRSCEFETPVTMFIKGAKWQQERMYSEEDLISFAHFYFKEEFNSTMQTSKSTDEILQEWFEQFKKK